MKKEGILNKAKFDFSAKSEIIQTIIIAILAFLTPTFLALAIQNIFGANSVIASNSQFIVGSIVNALLVLAAINLKGWKKILPIVFMPSISALFSGLVLNPGMPASTASMYMMPFIWIGNFILVASYKYLYIGKNWNFYVTGIVGILLKVAIIFGGFSILRGASAFPSVLAAKLEAQMGVNQIITAVIGIILVSIYAEIKTKRKIEE